MSQPTPYTPTTDFSQQEANNASGRSTVNTAALDAEFAAIETTLDQTLANIQLIQRDDGKLGDVIVEVRCLSQDVLNVIGGFNLTGLWSATKSYSVNDICSNGEYTYVCKTAHTSGLTFDATNWIQFGFTAGADAAQAAAEAQASAAAAFVSENNSLAHKNSASSSAASASSSASSSESNAVIASNKAAEASVSATAAANSAALAAASVEYAPVAVPTHSSTSKATPVDADEIPVVDSAASWALAKLTWANLKSTLKTYFDTLYASFPTQSGNAGKVLKTNGTAVSWGGSLNIGTAVNATSGTAIDFTSIPSWVKRITLAFDSVSTNGSSNYLLQIGAGSVEVTGYNSTVVGLFNTASVTATGPTTGFGLTVSSGASEILTGLVTLVNISGNTWVCSGSMQKTVGNVVTTSGSKSLSGVLDRLRIATINGTDTFDGGSINIIYE